MSFRILKISTRCKLETRLGYLVYRADNELKILLDEISTIVIENQQVCITAALMSELMNHNIKIIFCDNKHNPQGEIIPYNSCYDTRSKIISQLNWSKETCDKIWKNIVMQKIINQKTLLEIAKKDKVAINLLNEYLNSIELGDTTNREGLAAKVYFNNVFYPTFERHNQTQVENIYLDYGYSLLLSYINKEISIYGYNNCFGIHHCSERNFFNLGCDLMEPFRPFVDYVVIYGNLNNDNFKQEMMKMFSMEVLCGEKNMILENALNFYVLSVFNALNKKGQVVNLTFKE